jgi:exodeoxyribonuclease III
MRIISYNVNGIRAAVKKGFIEWLATNPAEVVCIQEPKATENDIDKSEIEKLGYHVYWFAAEKKGYSGVAVFSKIKADRVVKGTGHVQSDSEGRVIQMDIGKISIINAYFPSGTSGDERQAYKYVWLDEFFDYINTLRKKRKQLIIVGDYNIAHKEIDIHDPKGNKNSSGFLPEERAWMDKWTENGFMDTFRQMNPQATGAYSWWSQRFPSVRLNNKGWRIDYICATDNLKNSLREATIYPDVKHSDHCPIYAMFEIQN